MLRASAPGGVSPADSSSNGGIFVRVERRKTVRDGDRKRERRIGKGDRETEKEGQTEKINGNNGDTHGSVRL